jgi:hypothetical protein
MKRDHTEPRSSLTALERLLIGLALALGLGLRLFAVAAPWDRQFDGFQGSFFAICAVNYERLGFDALAGYPVANIDPTDGDRSTYYAYANHPPLVPWLAWAALELGAPAGWESAWQERRAPKGVEGPLRAPFLAFHLLGWLGLYGALRWSVSARVGAIGAAIYGLLPVTWLYAGLVNYENPSVGALLLALAAIARLRSTGAWHWLLLAAAAAALAAATTFAPVFFLPGIGLWCWLGRGRRGFLEGSLIAAALLIPIAAHGVFAARALELVGAEPDSLPTRARLLLAPLLDGSLPLPRWLSIQASGAWSYFGPGPSLLALVGLLLVPAAREPRGRRTGAAARFRWLPGAAGLLPPHRGSAGALPTQLGPRHRRPGCLCPRGLARTRSRGPDRLRSSAASDRAPGGRGLGGRSLPVRRGAAAGSSGFHGPQRHAPPTGVARNAAAQS